MVDAVPSFISESVPRGRSSLLADPLPPKLMMQPTMPLWNLSLSSPAHKTSSVLQLIDFDFFVDLHDTLGLFNEEVTIIKIEVFPRLGVHDAQGAQVGVGRDNERGADIEAQAGWALHKRI
eukprot:CAMPEP_0180448504 /NCGR_PEP_ID=MMETSP1036_2-20121128/17251_1 /TAXON_ID=632150 /ORGANISM="Azadinium spinosum, Strain 3D9" /LENGTH=120 /DNA_ID=CAMNT_0022454903 /DNA_START=110 /DNA_END=473 /DNA_ORIENTATION=-